MTCIASVQVQPTQCNQVTGAGHNMRRGDGGDLCVLPRRRGLLLLLLGLLLLLSPHPAASTSSSSGGAEGRDDDGASATSRLASGDDSSSSSSSSSAENGSSAGPSSTGIGSSSSSAASSTAEALSPSSSSTGPVVEWQPDPAYTPPPSSDAVRFRLTLAVNALPAHWRLDSDTSSSSSSSDDDAAEASTAVREPAALHPGLLLLLSDEFVSWLTALGMDYGSTVPVTSSMFSRTPFFARSEGAADNEEEDEDDPTVYVVAEMMDSPPAFEARKAYLRLRRDVLPDSASGDGPQRRYRDLALLGREGLLRTVDELCVSGPLNGTYARQCGPDPPRETQAPNGDRAALTGLLLFLCQSVLMGFLWHRARLLTPDQKKVEQALQWQQQRRAQKMAGNKVAQARVEEEEEEEGEEEEESGEDDESEEEDEERGATAAYSLALGPPPGTTALTAAGVGGEEDNRVHTLHGHSSVAASLCDDPSPTTRSSVAGTSFSSTHVAGPLHMQRLIPHPAVPALNFRRSANGGPLFVEPPSPSYSQVSYLTSVSQMHMGVTSPSGARSAFTSPSNARGGPGQGHGQGLAIALTPVQETSMSHANTAHSSQQPHRSIHVYSPTATSTAAPSSTAGQMMQGLITPSLRPSAVSLSIPSPASSRLLSPSQLLTPSRVGHGHASMGGVIVSPAAAFAANSPGRPAFPPPLLQPPQPRQTAHIHFHSPAHAQSHAQTAARAPSVTPRDAPVQGQAMPVTTPRSPQVPLTPQAPVTPRAASLTPRPIQRLPSGDVTYEPAASAPNANMLQVRPSVPHYASVERAETRVVTSRVARADDDEDEDEDE